MNEFPLIFQKVQHSHFRHQKGTSSLLRINLKGILKFNEIWPWELCTQLYNLGGGGGIPKIFSFMQFSQKIDGFWQNIHRAFRTHTTLYKQNPLEKFFLFTIYQNYTLENIGVSRLTKHPVTNRSGIRRALKTKWLNTTSVVAEWYSACLAGQLSQNAHSHGGTTVHFQLLDALFLLVELLILRPLIKRTQMTTLTYFIILINYKRNLHDINSTANCKINNNTATYLRE